MAQFIIVAFIASSTVTYLYNDPAKAWAKAQTLARNAKSFEIRDGATNEVMSVETLRERAKA